MNNPYSQSRNSQSQTPQSQIPQSQHQQGYGNPRQYGERHYGQEGGERHYGQEGGRYGRDRNERWGAEELRGRATWRDDNSNRAPNRSAWGEQQSDYPQSRFASDYSDYSGHAGEYDQDWQGGNYGEYGYDAGAASDHGMPSGEDYDYTQHQDYRLGNAPGGSQSRGENQRWGQGNRQQGGQQAWEGRSQALSDAQYGSRQPWREGGQMYGAQNYGQPYYRAPDYSSMSYGAQSYGAQSYGPRLYGGEFGYGDEFRTARENWRPSGGARAQEHGHRGKGPKGYVRTDERIREEICECLSDDPRIDASEIAVQVRDGIVTLEGSVQDRAQKHRAEDIADGCNGVKDVHNTLRVTRGGQGMGGNASTAQSSAAASAMAAGRGSESAERTNDSSEQGAAKGRENKTTRQ